MTATVKITDLTSAMAKQVSGALTTDLDGFSHLTRSQDTSEMAHPHMEEFELARGEIDTVRPCQ